MNLDRFLKLGEGAINENFVTWAEMAGTTRVNIGLKVRLVEEESNDFSGNEDMYIVVVIRRELCMDAGNVCCSILWFRGGRNLSSFCGG